MPHSELTLSLQQVLDEARALREDVHASEVARLREEGARRRQTRIGVVALGLLTVFVVLIGVVTVQNNQIGRATRQANDTLVDCTTPAGECYRKSQARTAAVVADLIRASTFVAQCARQRPNESGPAFDRFLEQCVAVKLGLRPGPSPTPKVTAKPGPPSGG